MNFGKEEEENLWIEIEQRIVLVGKYRNFILETVPT